MRIREMIPYSTTLALRILKIMASKPGTQLLAKKTTVVISLGKQLIKSWIYQICTFTGDHRLAIPPLMIPPKKRTRIYKNLTGCVKLKWLVCLV